MNSLYFRIFDHANTLSKILYNWEKKERILLLVPYLLDLEEKQSNAIHKLSWSGKEMEMQSRTHRPCTQLFEAP